ncbi:PREDICTED: collagen alpha-1(I) chain-like [Condylura cristata]|uniref:collagen alpha-1(I) chain-like n=1 Tax=Condylura cristata TaxID=143302 RepID=UPI000642F0B2|nr:PREDICTED: collagen alpha-1(I) chain-like [Condylura cristata]
MSTTDTQLPGPQPGRLHHRPQTGPPWRGLPGPPGRRSGPPTAAWSLLRALGDRRQRGSSSPRCGRSTSRPGPEAGCRVGPGPPRGRRAWLRTEPRPEGGTAGRGSGGSASPAGGTALRLGPRQGRVPRAPGPRARTASPLAAQTLPSQAQLGAGGGGATQGDCGQPRSPGAQRDATADREAARLCSAWARAHGEGLSGLRPGPAPPLPTPPLPTAAPASPLPTAGKGRPCPSHEDRAARAQAPAWTPESALGSDMSASDLNSGALPAAVYAGPSRAPRRFPKDKSPSLGERDI